MDKKIFIETERLFIKHIGPEDFAEMGRQQKDPDYMRFFGGPRTDEKIKWINELMYDHFCRYGFSMGLVFEKASNNPIGRAGIAHLDFQDVPEVEGGCFLMPAYWRKGYGIELGTAFLKHAFEKLQAPEFYATVDPKNIAACKLAEKAGLKFKELKEYTTLDKFLNYYAMSRAEFESLNNS